MADYIHTKYIVVEITSRGYLKVHFMSRRYTDCENFIREYKFSPSKDALFIVETMTRFGK